MKSLTIITLLFISNIQFASSQNHARYDINEFEADIPSVRDVYDLYIDSTSLPVYTYLEYDEFKKILFSNTCIGMANADKKLYVVNPIKPDYIMMDKKVYIRTKGELYDNYVLTNGWFYFDHYENHIYPLHNSLPYLSIYHTAVRFIKYENGIPVSGIINESYMDYLGTQYQLEGELINGRLHGTIATYQDGNKLFSGQTSYGNPVGEWLEYKNNKVIKTYNSRYEMR